MGTCGITLLVTFGIMIYCIAKSVMISKKGRIQSDGFPNERELLSMYNFTNPEMLQKMYELGAKIIFSDMSSGKTILTNKALCYKNLSTQFYVAPPSLNAEIKFDFEENTKIYTTTKNKSTVGRAVVGGVLAGGVGAVVGAASALSGNGTKTVSRTYTTGDYHLKISLSDVSDIYPKRLYVSKDIINKLGAFSFPQINSMNSPYIEYDISRIDIIQKYKITDYIQRAI